jgi:hypothetical protein
LFVFTSLSPAGRDVFTSLDGSLWAFMFSYEFAWLEVSSLRRRRD